MWAGAARRCGSAVPLEACECEDELMTTEADRVPSTVTTRGMAMTWWGSKAGDACAGSLPWTASTVASVGACGD